MSARSGAGVPPEPDAGDEELIERAYDALDAADVDAAFELAQQLAERRPELADGHFIAGLALFEAGSYRAAAGMFQAALDRAPAAAEILTYHAATHCILGDGTSAEQTLLRAAEAESPIPEAFYWLSLIAERRGEDAAAAAWLERAIALAPERYHAPFRIERDELEQAMHDLFVGLPAPVREALAQVPILIEDLPSDALLGGPDEPLTPDLLGLFTGASMAEDSVFGQPLEPVAIRLFRRNLERIATCREELLEEARVTLLHEIGHYLGLDEQDLEERELD